MKILSIKGASNLVFEHSDRTLRVEKLEVVDLPYQKIESLDFLRILQEYLREISIWLLPNGKNGGEALKFIIEEMTLDQFFIEELT